MQIHGFNKTTLLDYPGLVAATIFTGACNFRCPYCHNADLVLNPSSQPMIPEEEILSHLRKRKGITQGVCITGGEPTLQKDLKDFIKKLKELDLKVKLDSNGYKPEVLKDLVKDNLLDYIAMDVKAPLEEYDVIAGVKLDTSKLKESIDFLIAGDLPFEFRTTVIKDFHTRESFEKISELIKGAKNYYLQGYIDSANVIQPGLTSYTYEEMQEFLPIFEGKVEHVEIRGVE
ncbi:MAG: anaerobic ribonucleoside-triphosphate reductase activating protein [Lachnospiraceae bacterium]|nr:anaerobic ribonucleoside-triphosphate reductase activating protein [Lachnospiraceae bacterium]MBR5994407.1 anaerobic ribonucleoside-triphosphate reductase activating protein [Lachnospiraceae bacterium]